MNECKKNLKSISITSTLAMKRELIQTKTITNRKKLKIYILVVQVTFGID